MTPLVQIVLVAIGTYAIRSSAIVVLARRTIPPKVEQTFRLIAPAVMAALVANTLLLDHGSVRPVGVWHLAGLVAVGVALWTRSVGWTLLVGLIVYWGLEAIW
ncbi:MAG: AzlD domain-containing protein [Acidimicrobiales bacterium]|nr:AzlD domain-containing protein [Acidimicrobiales bacterium]